MAEGMKWFSSLLIVLQNHSVTVHRYGYSLSHTHTLLRVSVLGKIIIISLKNQMAQKSKTPKRFRRTLFMRTKHNMRIFEDNLYQATKRHFSIS